MTDAATNLSSLAATYPKFVEAPTQWASVGWSGQNLAEIQALFTAHGIKATVMQAGTDTLLIIIGGASLTYAVGEQVVICSDDGATWRHDSARRDLAGLVPLTDYYVNPSA
ncbi:hypothetical protein [Saccharopolyspora rosea]|uniref:Uncharacterized protein n=1 Tax=Saccharopolyspora rosea TaxID=524884 RepID=A0ABW3FUG8_9PSEU|nr:hypothetical protein [Saccharopolyspora rosea]